MFKKMENDLGVKIVICGKGFVKEGKGCLDVVYVSNQEEDFYCLIMVDIEDKVNKVKQLIYNVIEMVSIFYFKVLFLILIIVFIGCFDF